VSIRVGDNRTLALEAVRDSIGELPFGIYLLRTVLQQIRETALDELQLRFWGGDLAIAAVTLRNFELMIVAIRRLLVKNECEPRWGKPNQLRNIRQSFCSLQLIKGTHSSNVGPRTLFRESSHI
jgi:hypothetical protein